MELILLCKMLHKKISFFILQEKKICFVIIWDGHHDAKIYCNSYFYSNKSTLIKGNDFLIGDNTYPLSPFLIKPFNKPNEMQAEFIIVVQSFGKIKNRFAGIRDIDYRAPNGSDH